MAGKNTAPLHAVAYARFSSEMQRDESIDAQVRAVEDYARRNGYVLTATYADHARSATTDKRPEFQKMISDASLKQFDAIIVHKLDRFARNRYDSAHYKRLLKKYGVRVLSVTESLDGSPESIMLESVIEGMSEYYSANLSREVEKGKRENAYKGMHVGGTPPLGFDVDPETRLLVINPKEAESVKMIFDLYLRGYGYTEIRDELNRNGYKTKRGQMFGKNSLHEILRNEKYTGVYVYNKTSSKSMDHTFNRHSYKDDEDVIRIENVVPVIVSKEDFSKVQQKMKTRQHKGAQHKAVETYLLTGKIFCGKCGSAYVGNHRKAYENHIAYTSYKCNRKNNAVHCSNREIKRDDIEHVVLRTLSASLFQDRILPQLEEQYRQFSAKRDTESGDRLKTLQAQLHELDKNINNIVDVMMQTASVALAERLRSLEAERSQIQMRLAEIESTQRERVLAGRKLAEAFHQAKRMLESGSLEKRREIVQKYVERVTVYEDRLEIKLKIAGDFVITESKNRVEK